MNTHMANLLNAVAMIILGAWGYLGSATPSPTALIPVFLGVILLALNQGVKAESKGQSHAAVIITLVGFIALFKPFFGAMNRDDNGAMVRIGIMLLTNLVALVFFIRSFIAAKKARANVSR
jgi:hypothetical protein